jgi:hypothetical protein
MKRSFLKILTVILAVVLGGAFVFAKNNARQEQSQSGSTANVAIASCNDTFESTGVGNATSVKGAAGEAEELALAGAQALCPSDCPATLVKIVSIRTEKIITKVTERGQEREIVTYRVTITGQYMCGKKSS